MVGNMATKERTMEELSKEIHHFLKGMTIKEVEYTRYLIDAWYKLHEEE